VSKAKFVNIFFTLAYTLGYFSFMNHNCRLNLV